MNRILLLLLFALGAASVLSAQKYYTRDGVVNFVSDAPLEKIEAINDKALCVIDTESGAVELAVLIKSFNFKKALMQEHFNENYMESETYPKAIFKGKIDNKSQVDFAKSGVYEVEVSGDLTVHGVTNPVTTNGTLTVGDGNILAKSGFEIAVADYDIKIPKIVRENIAKVVAIEVDLELKPMEQ